MVALEGRDRVLVRDGTLSRFPRLAATAVLAVSASVIVGWLFHVVQLTSVVPGYTTMKFNTALCLGALAAAVLAPRRSVAIALAAAVVVVAVLTWYEIVADRSLGIDEILVHDPLSKPGAAPGRMAPATATALLALAVARVLIAGAAAKAAQVVLVVPLLISWIALLGYLFDVEQLYRVASLSSVALHTAGCLLLLTLALAAQIPGGVLPWGASGSGPGAIVVRQTLPVIGIGLPLLGVVRKILGDAGAFGEHFGIAIMVLVGTMIAAAATIRAARRLDISHAARLEAEESLRLLNASLVEGRDQAWAQAVRLGRELEEERARFERAVGNTDDIVWTIETTTGTPVVAYTSPNVGSIVGGQLPEGQTVNEAIVDRMRSEDRMKHAEFRRSMLAGVPAAVEVRVVGLDGVERWIWVRGAPRLEGDRTFYDGITTDVTDRHQLAEEREHVLAQEQLQVQKLSELNRVRDEFIAVAGHELRTPVAVILGYCDLLGDFEADPAAQREAIEVIRRRASQLNELVGRVFDLAKLDSGEMELDLEPVDVDRFLGDLIADYEPGAVAAGLTLSGPNAVVIASVLADRAQLRQVFDNLLSNALKYTPRGGHVRLEVSAGPEVVHFDVIDDGIGMDEADSPRVFDRLFRASSARSAGIPGTGLGLAISKALVEAQHGTIAVRGNSPHGTTFSVSLPRAVAAVPEGVA